MKIYPFRTVHFVKNLKIDDFLCNRNKDKIALCGYAAKDDPKMVVTNFIIYVSCPKCRQLYFEIQAKKTQKLCAFCSTPLKDSDYENKNDFFISCSTHKYLAKMETEKFFKDHPNYTTWKDAI